MFKSIRCFYCNSWTPRPQKKGRLREFKCAHCTAVNYLDRNGHITDPPAREQPSASSSVRYGHVPVQRSSSPVGPKVTSLSNVFCNTCLTNQHFRYENLRELDAVSREEDPAKWREQQAYIQALEARYPQVCARCRPKAREAIKRANYLTRVWNMMLSMEKTKSGEYAPVVQGRLWRSVVLRLGQIGREASVLGQTLWHVVGARMEVANAPFQHFSGYQPFPPESVGGAFTSCTSQTLFADRVHPRCFEDVLRWMPAILILAFFTILWNNQLRSRYLDRKPGRMVGLTDYYMLQAFVLSIRSVAWYLLRDPWAFASSIDAVLPDAKRLYQGAHVVMIAIIGFNEIVSRRLIQLENKYRVTPQRDEDILPETPTSSSRPTNLYIADQNTKEPSWMTRAPPQHFPLSALGSRTKRSDHNQKAPTYQSAVKSVEAEASLKYQPSHANEGMDWTPTPSSSAQNSFVGSAYHLRSRNSSSHDAASSGSSLTGFSRRFPDPGTQQRPQAPNHLATSARKPASAPTITQSSFLKDHARKPQKMWDTISDATTEFDDDDDDKSDVASVWGESHNPKQSEFRMAAPKLWLNQDKVDTGLESIFDEVFTLKDQEKQSNTNGGNEDSTRGHGAMFGDDSVAAPRDGGGTAMEAIITWVVTFTLLAGIMGVVLAVVKGWVSSRWRE